MNMFKVIVAFLLLCITIACTEEKGVDEENLIETYTWWTSGGEEAALKELVSVFHETNPNTQFINGAQTGGAGINIREKIIDLIGNNTPPDSYQIHIGDELGADIQWLEPIDDLYEAQGWDSIFPPEIIQSVTFDGHKYAVPLNVHRSNVLWYNKSLAEEHSIDIADISSSWEAFFTKAEELKAKGVRVFAFEAEAGDDGSSWVAAHIMESILLAHLGGDNFKGLFRNGYSWDSQEVRDAFADLKKLVSDYGEAQIGSSKGFKNMAECLADADNPCMFAIMGDWFDGELKTKDWTPGEDFVWAASPGTGSYFIYLSDSFVLPQDAPHRENALAWLAAVGSQDGQNRFNAAKGSIPSRMNADKKIFDAYLQSAIDDFASLERVGSFAHGALGHSDFKAQYFGVIGKFISGDITEDEAISALMEECNKVASMKCE